MSASNLDEAILGTLPTARDTPAWLTTAEICRRLEAKGHRVDYLRKIRRHLTSLESDKQVISMENGRDLLWQRMLWAQRSGLRMSASEAVAFNVLQRFTSGKLPPAVTHDIEPLFNAAEARLSEERSDNRPYRAWADKVDSVGRSFELLPPRLNPNTFQDVATATFFERELLVKYRAASQAKTGSTAREKRLWPLALVESAGVMYMVAQDPEFPPKPGSEKSTWLRSMYRVDRITSVKESGKNFDYPLDFRLRTYIETQRKFDFEPEAPVVLELAFDGNGGNHLMETPMSKDQQIGKLPDGRMTVSGTVTPSLKLRGWLRSLGTCVEILAPQSLRDEFAADYAAMARRYGV